MKKLRWLLFVAIAGEMLVGCGIQPQSTPSVPVDAVETEPETALSPSPQTPAQPLTVAEATTQVEELVAAIEAGQVEQILPYVRLERDRTEAGVQAAIAHFKTYFDNQPITQVELQSVENLGETPDGLPIQRFTFEIATDSGIRKSIHLYQETGVYLVDEFLNYSYWANALMEQAIAAIQANDAERLAQLLSGDGEPYPIAQAEAAIARYQSAFDTLEYEFETLERDRQVMVYRIYGTKQGAPVEHPVQVVYGDGLVGLRDDWIP